MKDISIKAVIFDAFGTLAEIGNPRRAYLPIIKGWPSGVSQAYQAIMTCDCAASELGFEAGCSPEVMAAVEAEIQAEIDSMALFPEVYSVLERLQKMNLKWAIASNLASPYAEPLLKLLPSAPDVCAWSFAVGHRKPEREIYQYACQELGCAPSSVLMVGDSLQNDYQKPISLGLRALYLSRDKSIAPNGETIFDLTQIFNNICG